MVSEKIKELKEQQKGTELQEYHTRLEILTKSTEMLPDGRRTETIPTIFGKVFDENFISDYLAYILNPKKNGVGTSPLRKFVENFKENITINEAEIDFNKVTMNREYTLKNNRRIDLLIKVDNSLIIGIENKIFSKEGDKQTKDYAECINKEFIDYTRLLCYLTPRKDSPESTKFISLSYDQLGKLLRDINYDFTENIRKSVIFNDFIIHLEEYIVNKKLVVNEKTKLYIDNHEIINDLSDNFNSDAESVFNAVESLIKSYFSGSEWKFWFKSSREYQQIYKDDWLKDDLYIHYEYHFSATDLLLKNKIKFMVDVERDRRDDFIKRYKDIQDKDKKIYQEKGIEFLPNKRLNAIAYKEYPFTLENLESVLEKSLEEFVFLEKLIDESID